MVLDLPDVGLASQVRGALRGAGLEGIPGFIGV
ncbi:MAG: hypothetical protein RLZZ272_229, partial [Actinomycetota bacterium]